MNSLTPTQCKILAYIVSQIAERGLPPTHREISNVFGWTSNAAAAHHLLALEKKGFIRTLIRISRGIQLTSGALEWAKSQQFEAA